MLRALFLSVLLACGGSSANTTPVETSTPAEAPALERLRFNQLALRLDLPLFWERDADGDTVVDPDEVRALAFYGESPVWTRDAAFTPSFDAAFAAILTESRAASPREERLRLVHQELDSAAPTLLLTDLSALDEIHRAFAEKMLEVGAAIDALYAKQVGMVAVRGAVADDPASQSIYRRNWGLACRGAATEREPACTAASEPTPQPVDVYPPALQRRESFCDALMQDPAASSLITPFVVVRDGERNGTRTLVPVPYTVAYREPMQRIAELLEEAATTIEADPQEGALVTYLRAAAGSFRSNDWHPADEAWSRMNATNSSWYVRVAPDEVYWDPCSLKAGFHLTLARIDRASLEWQARLDPLRAEMETRLAALTDAYEAREVAFHLPDFIAIVANFGDDRDAFGATIGQSLPNWGPVAEEGRGRTVAMTNLYTDPDSQARGRATAASLFSADTMAHHASDADAALMSTILHEATHNLGPTRVPSERRGRRGGLDRGMGTDRALARARETIDRARMRGGFGREWERLHRGFRDLGWADEYLYLDDAMVETPISEAQREYIRMLGPAELAEYGTVSYYGTKSHYEDIADAVAYALSGPLLRESGVPEGPPPDLNDYGCIAMRAHDRPSVPQDLSVVFTKLAFLKDLGLLQSEVFRSCTGERIGLPVEGEGVTVYDDGEVARVFRNDPRAQIGTVDGHYVFEMQVGGTAEFDGESYGANLRLELDLRDAATLSGDAVPVEQVAWPRGVYSMAPGYDNHFELRLEGAEAGNFDVTDGFALVVEATNDRILGSVFVREAWRFQAPVPVPQTFDPPLQFRFLLEN